MNNAIIGQVEERCSKNGREEEDERIRDAEMEECLEVHAEGMDASRPQENKDHNQKMEEDEEEEDRKTDGEDNKERVKRPRFREKIWDGAPEFKWKAVETREEGSRLIIDNLSIADLSNPFIYQTLTRAKSVNLNFINSSIKGNFDHAIFRKGRLTAEFQSDTQAMAQAVNGLVFVRTPSHRPRLKVLLPQTSQTKKMSHLLEMKLGRVMEPHLKSRQLLVRSVAEEMDEAAIKAVVSNPTALESVEIVQDCVERKCAVLTYRTPADAIEAHLRSDSLPLASSDSNGKHRFAKVFFMEGLCSLFHPPFMPSTASRSIQSIGIMKICLVYHRRR